MKSKSDLPNPSPVLTHLWRAHLSLGGRNKESFFFRAPDDCSNASVIAGMIADQSAYITMRAAKIVSIECMGRLLN
jgi:hypothetical protein